MDPVEATRIKAMLAVMEGDFLYQYRRICRWYSKTFYTPLPQVEELPEDVVLQAFFEEQFENMGKAKRRREALEMTETPEETLARKKDEDSKSDEAFLKKMEKQAKKESKKQLKKLAQDAEQAAKQIAALANKEMTDGMAAIPKAAKKAKPSPPPEISMNFDTGGNLIEEESVLPPPRKR